MIHTMVVHNPLPFSVQAIRLRPCGPELDRRIEKLLSETLEPSDLGRVAVEDFNGNEVVCFFLEATKTDRIVAELRAMGVLETQRELSQEILLGRSCGAEIDLTLSNYPDLVRTYRLCHLTIDDVLDKMNGSGLERLDDVDREVLASA